MIQTPRIPQRGHGISPLIHEVTCNQNVGTFFVLILIRRYHIFNNIGNFVLLANECSFISTVIGLYMVSFLIIVIKLSSVKDGKVRDLQKNNLTIFLDI